MAYGSIQTFVEECVIRGRNLLDKVTKVKQNTWMSAGKYIQLNTGSNVLTLKATTSLIARLLVIDRSSLECRSGRSGRDA